MSERPSWLRADVLLAVAVGVVIVVAVLSPRWRAGLTGAIGGAGASGDITAGVDRSRVPSHVSLKSPDPKIDPSKLGRHRSPFDDAVTARAESLCVRMVTTQVGYALKEPVTVKVDDRYGTGNEDDGRGVYLIFEGMARTPTARLSAWRCAMESLGAYPGMPTITHVEAP